MSQTLSRDEKKSASICTYPGCKADASDDNEECPRHHKRTKARKRKYWNRRRAKWQRRKRCPNDGRKRQSGSRLCVRCLIKLGRLKSGSLDKRLDKSARLRARTVVDKEGRTRYLGKSRRGVPSTAQNDRASLVLVLKAAQQALDGVDYYESSEAQGKPRIQREDIRQGYVALVFTAAREALALCERAGWTIPGLNDENSEIDATERKTRG